MHTDFSLSSNYLDGVFTFKDSMSLTKNLLQLKILTSLFSVKCLIFDKDGYKQHTHRVSQYVLRCFCVTLTNHSFSK